MSKKAIWVVAILIGLTLGNVTGFMIGAYSTKAGQDFLEAMVATEEPADVAQPRRIARPAFALQHPANWKVDTAMKDYSPDHYFVIESPGSTYTTFILFDMETDPAENIEDEVKAQAKTIKNAVRTKFNRWGRYSGRGVELKGRVMGINKGGARIFSHSSKNKSFIVVEQYYDDDFAQAGPGLKLIESSFRLK